MNENSSIRKQIPNALSVFRFLISAVLAVLAFVTAPLWIAQVLLVLGIVSDKLDGTLARAWHAESELGKQLESIVDVVFLFTALIYVVAVLDFPAWAFTGAMLVGVAGAMIRVVCSVVAKKLFYEKSQFTRIMVGFGYVVLFCYFFQIPYRDWLLLLLVACGVFHFIHYSAMMIRFALRNRTHT